MNYYQLVYIINLLLVIIQLSIFESDYKFSSKLTSQMKKFKIHSQLGKGSFGKVQLATHIPTGDYVAIKTISKNKLKLKQDLSMVNKQIAVFKSVYHENIIQLYEIVQDERNLYFVMQYAEKGDLLSFIKSNGTLTESQALKFAKQLAETIDFLHNQKFIAHRDIKLANILLSSKNNTIKLADFGLSNFYDKNNQILKTSCGSPCYSAPQILRGAKYYPIAADIWSLGVVLFAMIEGCLPFYDQNVKQLYRYVIKGQYCDHQKCSKEVRVLIRKILQVNPQFRISIKDLINQLDTILSKIVNKSILQAPQLNQQSNIYVQNLRKQKIIRILVLNGYKQQQVRNAIQYRQKTKKSRKFNDLNTFYELLNKKKLNHINSLLKKYQQDSKQNDKSIKISPINPFKQLKRTNSNFTKDSVKNSTPQVKQCQKIRFVRNTNLKSLRINKIVESERRESLRKQRQKNGTIQGLVIHRKKIQLQQQEKVNKHYECKDITKQYSSLLSNIGQSNEGYIRLKSNNTNSVNISFVGSQVQTNTNISKLITKRSLKRFKKQSRNSSIDTIEKEQNASKTYRTQFQMRGRDFSEIFTSREKQIVNTSGMHMYSDWMQDDQMYMSIQRQPFNIMHTYNGKITISQLQKCLQQICNRQGEGETFKQKIDNFKYRISRYRNNQFQQTSVQVMKIQAFTNLKLIKIDPFDSGFLFKIKNMLKNLSNA